ncbi:hypothetical protein SO802_008668 [Lithocarpus litseifolius]|uniref:Uncharacterized protein n=1 Tax=Lithocarpus litseifolius TaxID=425828 RepID=A0AAW2D9Z1_9ROSI
MQPREKSPMANRHYYVHHPETTDDEYAERAQTNNGKNKKPMTSSSDESESALKLNLRASQEGDDHDMDANKFSTTIEVELNPRSWLRSLIDSGTLLLSMSMAER